jgi:high-affinity nickel permease
MEKESKSTSLIDPTTDKFLFIMSLISIVIIILAVVYISNKAKQDKKIDEIKIEQTRKNMGIAEGLLEKELNKVWI